MKDEKKTKRMLINELRALKGQLAESGKPPVQGDADSIDPEAMMASILDAIPHAVVGLKDRKIFFANGAVETVFGWRPEDLIGGSIRVFYRTDEEYIEIAERFYPFLEKDRTHSEEFPCRHRDGRDITCWVSTSRIGELLRERMIIATYQDISARKQAEEDLKKYGDHLEELVNERAKELLETNEQLQHEITQHKRDEEALRESEKRLSDIINFLPDATFAIDKGGRVIAWNLAIEEMTGVRAESVLGKGNYEYGLPFYGYRRPILIDLVFMSDENLAMKYSFVTKRGDVILAEADVTMKGEGKALWGIAGPLYDSRGNIVGAIESIRDITDRKQAEEALEKAVMDLKELNFIVNKSPAIAFLWRAAEGWPVEFVSENISQFGYTPGDLTSGRVPFARIVHPDDLSRVASEVVQYTQEGLAEFSQEYRMFAQSGDIRWIDDRTWIRRDSDGRVTHYQGIIIDITDRKEMEEALRESEDKFRILTEKAAVGVYLIQDMSFQYVNPKCAEIWGYSVEDLLEQKIENLIVPEDLLEVKENLLKRIFGEIDFLQSEFKAIRKNGEVFHMEAYGSRITYKGRPAIMGTLMDISERKYAEEERRRMEKMQGILAMAGTICHEINQPMQIISGYSDLLLKNSSEQDPIRPKLDTINLHIRRMAEITKKLMLLREYETQDYVGFSRIINIHKDASEDP